MRTFRKLGLMTVVLCVAGSASAQIPDEFTNLKVLPKDISKREMIDTMRGFSMALGARCQHCHVGESTTSLEGYDFASDEKEAKKVAREMMKMAHEINATLLPATKRTELTEVRCVTCHRGLENPETLDRIIMAVIEKDGVPAAIERYRELRVKYYGIGAYDFGVGTLNDVAERFASEGADLDGAIAIVKLNLEFNPEAARAHLMLGQLYATKGDKTEAIASIERALELEPGNSWATKLLEKVRSSE